MAEEQHENPIPKVVYQYITAGDKPKWSLIAKIKSKALWPAPVWQADNKKGCVASNTSIIMYTTTSQSSLLSTSHGCFDCYLMAKVIRGWDQLLPYAGSNYIGISCSKMWQNMWKIIQDVRQQRVIIQILKQSWV